ncbi:MAG: hypothetical protein HYZ14_18490 [Bacteroidetes bacterium]|nr:hypothetical protein [Bacteroidota bacterium]
MFNWNPLVKIVLVFLVCLSMAYVNYLMHNSQDFMETLRASVFLGISAFIYLLAIAFFATYFWRQRYLFVLAVWLALNLSFLINFSIRFLGYLSPMYVQYSQSITLFVFAALLAFTRDKFPNWLRLFSLACLLTLIPAIIFYFEKMWLYYEYAVYVVCFTPMLLSFVFLKERRRANYELIDSD